MMNMPNDRLCQTFEGQLYKYTNVVKGWQYRWFVLDPETGFLHYYLNKSQRKQRPRRSVHLAGAVIAPSDEDSSTFTVNSATGEVYKLQAADARERQEWVNHLRAAAEMHAMAGAQANPPLPPCDHSVPGIHSVTNTHSHRVQCTREVLDALRNAQEHIQKAEHSGQTLCQAFDNLPTAGPITHVDSEVLNVKASTLAVIACLGQCLSILQLQQIAPVPVPRHTPVKKSPLPIHTSTQSTETTEKKRIKSHTTDIAHRLRDSPSSSADSD